MDKLEKYILKNRDEFDLLEPSSDLWEKIKKRNEKTKTIQFNWKKNLYRAAIVIFIVSVTFFVQEYRHSSDNEINQSSQNNYDIIIPELKEVEDYYNSEVNRKMKEINKLASFNPEITQHIESDLAELDSIYIDLKEDLKENIDNEEVINAMINNYKIKLEILEEILFFLEGKNNVKNEKAKEYEL
jgi:hypothetical protein